MSTIFHRCSIVLLATVCLTVHAKNDKQALSAIEQHYSQCLPSTFTTGESIATEHMGGYGIEVQGERYWVMLEERLAFPLLQKDSGATIAEIKLDRPPSAEFKEQVYWRERFWDDVATRAGTVLTRSAVAPGVQLLALNRPTISGKFVGISLLIDTPRQLFIQWAWKTVPRYTVPQDVVATQAVIWSQLLPCLFKP